MKNWVVDYAVRFKDGRTEDYRTDFKAGTIREALDMAEKLIDELLKFISENGVKGTDIFVELCAMPDKIPFYEKFGFSANEAQRLRMMYPIR